LEKRKKLVVTIVDNVHFLALSGKRMNSRDCIVEKGIGRGVRE
jgi:hypothetical protein